MSLTNSEATTKNLLAAIEERNNTIIEIRMPQWVIIYNQDGKPVESTTREPLDSELFIRVDRETGIKYIENDPRYYIENGNIKTRELKKLRNYPRVTVQEDEEGYPRSDFSAMYPDPEGSRRWK